MKMLIKNCIIFNIQFSLHLESPTQPRSKKNTKNLAGIIGDRSSFSVHPSLFLPFNVAIASSCTEIIHCAAAAAASYPPSYSFMHLSLRCTLCAISRAILCRPSFWRSREDCFVRCGRSVAPVITRRASRHFFLSVNYKAIRRWRSCRR